MELLYGKLNALKYAGIEVPDKSISQRSVSKSALTSKELQILIDLLKNKMLASELEKQNSLNTKSQKPKRMVLKASIILRYVIPVWMLAKWLVEKLWDHVHWA